MIFPKMNGRSNRIEESVEHVAGDQVIKGVRGRKGKKEQLIVVPREEGSPAT